MAANAAFFAGASQFSIHSFNSQQTNNVPSPDLDPALLILHKNRALEACHTSKTSLNAAKCKEGTQVEVIEDMTTWADDVLDDPDPPPESILWLRGPAGGGKTCILRTVADIYYGNQSLAGVYFFSTRVAGLDNEAPFIATLASYLIEAIPALFKPVLETIRSNPTIFDQSLEYQLEKLISNHILSIPSESPTPRLLIIDGFDECRDPAERAHLLRIIHSLVTPPHSFRVIIASRPEFDIRTAFKRPHLKSVTRILRLESYDTSEEIHRYLADEFVRIRDTHPAKNSIPLEWPGQDTLEGLTDRSSGIWAYPSTVIKYVCNPHRHPVEQLKHVIDASSNASSGRPFAELDALYDVVLSPPDTDIPLMKQLLHIIVEVTHLGDSHILLPSTLDDLLQLEKGTTEITLCDLHSVLSAADPDRPYVHFHHKSLEDYLCSPERSGNLHQSREDTWADLMTVCTLYLQRWNSKLMDPNAAFNELESDLPIIDDSIGTMSTSNSITSTHTQGDTSAHQRPAETSPKLESVEPGELANVYSTPEPITTSPSARLPDLTNPTRDDVAAHSNSPPKIVSSKLGTGEGGSVGLAAEPVAATSLSQAPSSSIPVSAQVVLDAPIGLLPWQTPPDLDAGEATDAHPTPLAEPRLVDSELFVELAGPIFNWLVLPILVVSFAIYIFMQTDVTSDMCVCV
ncbi:hypothetical protein MD484_g4600, partial [Candolleomyces efflorescens]